MATGDSAAAAAVRDQLKHSSATQEATYQHTGGVRMGATTSKYICETLTAESPTRPEEQTPPPRTDHTVAGLTQQSQPPSTPRVIVTTSHRKGRDKYFNTTLAGWAG